MSCSQPHSHTHAHTLICCADLITQHSNQWPEGPESDNYVQTQTSAVVCAACSSLWTACKLHTGSQGATEIATCYHLVQTRYHQWVSAISLGSKRLQSCTHSHTKTIGCWNSFLAINILKQALITIKRVNRFKQIVQTIKIRKTFCVWGQTKCSIHATIYLCVNVF